MANDATDISLAIKETGATSELLHDLGIKHHHHVHRQGKAQAG